MAAAAVCFFLLIVTTSGTCLEKRGAGLSSRKWFVFSCTRTRLSCAFIGLSGGQELKACLVTAANVPGVGIGVKIACDKDSVVYQHNYSGPSLSRHNSDEIWVENLKTADGSAVRYVLLLPLRREIGALEIRYDAESPEKWATDFWTLELADTDGGSCQRLYIQRVVMALYAVCIYKPDDSDSSSTRLYEIMLSDSSLQESSVTFENFGKFDGLDFTNLVYAGQEQTNHFFFVARDDDNMVRINPVDHSASFFLLDHTECTNLTYTHIQYVAPLGELLLHYSWCCNENQTCSRYGVYYDTYNEEWIRSTFGLPYHCPDPNIKVTVHHPTDQFETQSSMNHELEVDGFLEGLCSGSRSRPWFAYQDKDGRIFALDLSSSDTSTPRMVSENGCLQGPSCKSIRNISDILVIQEFNTDNLQVCAKGMRPHENYSTVFNICNSEPGFFAVINVPLVTSVLPTSTVKVASSQILMPISLSHSMGHSQSQVVPSPTQAPTMNTEKTIIIIATTVPTATLIVLIIVSCIICRYIIIKLLGFKAQREQIPHDLPLESFGSQQRVSSPSEHILTTPPNNSFTPPPRPKKTVSHLHLSATPTSPQLKKTADSAPHLHLSATPTPPQLKKTADSASHLHLSATPYGATPPQPKKNADSASNLHLFNTPYGALNSGNPGKLETATPEADQCLPPPQPESEGNYLRVGASGSCSSTTPSATITPTAAIDVPGPADSEQVIGNNSSLRQAGHDDQHSPPPQLQQQHQQQQQQHQQQQPRQTKDPSTGEHQNRSDPL